MVAVQTISRFSRHVLRSRMGAGVERVHPLIDAAVAARAMWPLGPLVDVSVSIHSDILDAVAVVHYCKAGREVLGRKRQALAGSVRRCGRYRQSVAKRL